jgi:predicted DsbA family dithiol-disulfide isomerase
MADRMLSRMGPERTASSLKHLNSIGSAEGITFNWNGKTGKTKQSHQLLNLARTKSSELQCKVAEELFRLHFEEQRDITDLQSLIDAGELAGLDSPEILSWLENGNVGDLVDKEAQEARDNGISSVPQFSLQGGKYPLDGAQDAMDFFEVFMKIKEEERI